MKKKVIYEAIDGEKFESYLECENHEKELLKQHDEAVLSDAVNILIDLDKNFWPNDRIYTTLENTIEKCRYNPGIYLQAMIRDTFNKKDEISYSKLEIEIKNIFFQYKYGSEVFDKYLDSDIFESAQEEATIRHDFAAALRNCKKGTDLSFKLHFAFSDNDITELAKLHKSNKFRKKIENLLEDCNFHYECGKFAKNEYDEFLK